MTGRFDQPDSLAPRNLPRDASAAALAIIRVKGNEAAFWICTQVGRRILAGDAEGLRRFEAIAAAFDEMSGATHH